MDFLKKLGRFLLNNFVYTAILIIAFAYFFKFTEGQVITGILITISALLVCFIITILYEKYKKLPASEKPTISDIKIEHKKTVVKKTPAKKAAAKKKAPAKKKSSKK